MRTLLSVMFLGAFAWSGCVRTEVTESSSRPKPRAGAAAAPAAGQPVFLPVTVTPEKASIGKVAWVNTPGRFVVLNFPLGRMAAPEQRLDLYRRGVKVGEVKVTGPQREDNIVADLVTGEAEAGDEVRGQ